MMIMVMVGQAVPPAVYHAIVKATVVAEDWDVAGSLALSGLAEGVAPK